MPKKTHKKKPTAAPQLPTAKAPLEPTETAVVLEHRPTINFIDKPHKTIQLLLEGNLIGFNKELKKLNADSLNSIYYKPKNIAICRTPDTKCLGNSLLEAPDRDARILDINTLRHELIVSNPIFTLIYTMYKASTDKTAAAAKEFRSKALQTMTKMIVNGLDINITSIDGCTPLHYACLMGTPATEVIEFLLRNGANVNAKTITSQATPLHYVRYGANEAMGILLLDAGADISARTVDGISCINAIKHLNISIATNLFIRAVNKQVKLYGFTAANDIVKRDGDFLPFDSEVKVFFQKIANAESKYKIKLKLTVDELLDIITASLDSRITVKQLQTLQKISCFFEDIPKLQYIFLNINERIEILDNLKDYESLVLQEVQTLFNLIHKSDRLGAKEVIAATKKSVMTNYSILKGLQDALLKEADVSFDISHIEARIDHLNSRLSAHKLGTIGDAKRPEEAEVTTSSDSDEDALSPKKEAVFDGRFSHENLRLLATEFSNNSASPFVASVKEALYFSDVTGDKDIEATSKLTQILAKLKTDQSLHAKAIKYAQHRLPPNFILYFLEESDERAFENYLSATDEKSPFQAFAEAIEARGGTVEREWPKAGDFVKTLEKLISGNYIKITKVEFSNLLDALGFETKGFEEGNLRFHAIHKITGAKVGGHFIHKQDQDRKGEVHRNVLQKLKGILAEDGTFEHYLEHHDAFSASAAGAVSASSSAAFPYPAEELELDFVGSARGAFASTNPTTKQECLELLDKILYEKPSVEELQSLPRAYSIIGREMHPDLKDVIENKPGQLNLGNLRRELASMLEFCHETEHATVAPDLYSGVSLAGADGNKAGAGALADEE